MLQKIVLLLLLLALAALLYLLSVDTQVSKSQQPTYKTESIPSVKIPQESIHFSIKKRSDGVIEFGGSFANKETPILLAQNFVPEALEYRIEIQPELLEEKELIALLQKLLKPFVEAYREGTITFKQGKLLVSGKVEDRNMSDRVDALLSYSTINSFNNTELVTEATELASELNALLEEEGHHHTIPSLEMNATLMELEAIAKRQPLEAKPKPQPQVTPTPKPIKSQALKREVTREEKTPRSKEQSEIQKPVMPPKVQTALSAPMEKNPKESPETKVSQEPIEASEKLEQTVPSGLSEAEAYRRQLEANMPDEDMMALPSVQTVDMNIEAKIRRGEIQAEKTKKPMIHKETLHIPPKDTSKQSEAPFAKLYETQENLPGVVSDEIVASPSEEKR